MDIAKVAAQLPADEAAATVPVAGVIAPVFGKGQRPAASQPLQRTGTDDARESNLASLLEHMQAQQLKDRM
jgi:hypothetical protein